MNYIGIDPGLSGCFAIIDHNGKVKLCIPMPLKNNDVDVRTLAAHIQAAMKEDNTFAILERVGARPGQGVCAMFTFGQVVGEIKAVLKMLRCPFEEATKELKKVHSREKNSMKKDAKLVACKYIEKRFPSVDLYRGKKNPHDGMAEALCMA